MPKTVDRVPLPAPSPGTQRHLVVHRYRAAGDMGAPKAYIQASLHADEPPGMLVAHHLIGKLDALDAAGKTRGDIAVVPAANPIGLDQFVAGQHLGRFALGPLQNFNRGFPDIAADVAARVQDALTADVPSNIAAIRAAARDVLDERIVATPLDALRRHLMRLAIDADLVLDLHCNWDAVPYMFIAEDIWPEGRDIAAWLGAEAVLTATHSGGEPFDEVFSGLWHDLAARFDHLPIPPACVSVTVELRGERDVEDELAAADADALIALLATRGLVDIDPGPAPAPKCAATPLAALEHVASPVPGVLVHKVAVGRDIPAGTVVAEVVDPMAADVTQARTVLRTTRPGRVVARRGLRVCQPGDTVVQVAGTEAFRTGPLLAD